MKNAIKKYDHDTHLSVFENMGHEDHFEYGNLSVNHADENADIFDQATNIPVYGQAYDYARKIGGALSDIGKMFGKHEDTSMTGYKNYIAQHGRLPFYPTKDEMIKAAQQGNWEKVEPGAISASYDPGNGTWVRGDWHFVVTSTNPITAQSFKGANETHTLHSPVQASVPVNTSPQNAAVMSAAGSPSGGANAPAQPSNAVVQTPPMGNAPSAYTTGKPTGSPMAADVTGMFKTMPQSQMLIYGGIALVVIILITIVAIKK